TLFTVSDPNGLAVTEYRFRDTAPNSGGTFTLDGIKPAAGAEIVVAPADFHRVAYVAGSDVGLSSGIEVSARNAFNVSSWLPLAVTTVNFGTPVVTADDRSVGWRAAVPVASLFTVSDADGDAAASYEFRDQDT